MIYKKIARCIWTVFAVSILTSTVETNAAETWAFPVSMFVRSGYLEKESFPQVDLRLGVFRKVSENWSLGLQYDALVWKNVGGINHGLLFQAMCSHRTEQGRSRYFRVGAGPVSSRTENAGLLANIEYGFQIHLKSANGIELPMRAGLVYSPLLFKEKSYSRWSAFGFLVEFSF